MDKYCISFSWYKDHYCTELSTRRNFYIKATSNEESIHIAHERCDIDTNELRIDEICVRCLTKPKRKHIKKRYKLQYKYYPVLYV